MRTTIFTIDRAGASVRAALAESIASHLSEGEIVQVEDSRKPPNRRLRYTIQWIGEAGHVFESSGHPLGIFAHLDALIDHAETATA